MKLVRLEGKKYEGVIVKIGAKEYLVPSLSIQQIDDNKELIAEVREVPKASAYELIVKSTPLIHMAIQRNYPDVTLEDIKNDLDLNSFRHAVDAVFGVSGLKAEQGETKAAAESASAAAAESVASQ